MTGANLRRALGGHGSGPSPTTPPTRAAICKILCSFQGLVATTRQLGSVNWWDPMMADLTDPADRLAVYQQKRADIRPGAPNGDTHLNLTLDMTGLACLPKMRALITEAITLGGMTGVLLMLRGDGQSTNVPPGGHDPDALGWEWLMANFQAVWNFFKEPPDLTPWIVFCPGYDGVIPAWQPFTRVNEFARMARAVMGPSGYLAIEPSGGYWSWSGEQNDWATSDGQCFDVVLQELNIGTAPPTPPPANLLNGSGGWSQQTLQNDLNNPWDSVWQIVGHMVQPFNRPHEMPNNDYPDGIPYSLGGGTPRGPFTYVLFEHSTYEWIKAHNITRAQIDARRQCYLDMGCTVVC